MFMRVVGFRIDKSILGINCSDGREVDTCIAFYCARIKSSQVRESTRRNAIDVDPEQITIPVVRYERKKESSLYQPKV